LQESIPILDNNFSTYFVRTKRTNTKSKKAPIVVSGNCLALALLKGGEKKKKQESRKLDISVHAKDYLKAKDN